jgi:hypothetical protein
VRAWWCWWCLVVVVKMVVHGGVGSGGGVQPPAAAAVVVWPARSCGSGGGGQPVAAPPSVFSFCCLFAVHLKSGSRQRCWTPVGRRLHRWRRQLFLFAVRRSWRTTKIVSRACPSKAHGKGTLPCKFCRVPFAVRLDKKRTAKPLLADGKARFSRSVFGSVMIRVLMGIVHLMIGVAHQATYC